MRSIFLGLMLVPALGCSSCGDDGVSQPVPGVACDDAVKNGDETDVDCGGSCTPCADGLV